MLSSFLCRIRPFHLNLAADIKTHWTRNCFSSLLLSNLRLKPCLGVYHIMVKDQHKAVCVSTTQWCKSLLNHMKHSGGALMKMVASKYFLTKASQQNGGKAKTTDRASRHDRDSCIHVGYKC
ncbi:hypothetical protein GOODEAATRI_010370 [Goodea atripinnis]|uniref:Uncharacterized protein n=1 Tax=Goodea atripinnis TaxID=208336 RepID=A0ABV0N098_9TELE